MLHQLQMLQLLRQFFPEFPHPVRVGHQLFPVSVRPGNCLLCGKHQDIGGRAGLKDRQLFRNSLVRFLLSVNMQNCRLCQRRKRLMKTLYHIFRTAADSALQGRIPAEGQMRPMCLIHDQGDSVHLQHGMQFPQRRDHTSISRRCQDTSCHLIGILDLLRKNPEQLI